MPVFEGIDGFVITTISRYHCWRNADMLLIVRYAMYTRRIWLLKLIFFASLNSVRITFSENEGVQIFPPLPLFWGRHFRFGRLTMDYVPIAAIF